MLVILMGTSRRGWAEVVWCVPLRIPAPLYFRRGLSFGAHGRDEGEDPGGDHRRDRLWGGGAPPEAPLSPPRRAGPGDRCGQHREEGGGGPPQPGRTDRP